MEGGREEGWKEGREGGKEGGGKEEGRQEWLNTAYYIKCTRQTSIAEWFVFKITTSVCTVYIGCSNKISLTSDVAISTTAPAPNKIFTT